MHVLYHIKTNMANIRRHFQTKMAKRACPLVLHRAVKPIIVLSPYALYTPLVDLSCVGWDEVDACISESRNLLRQNLIKLQHAIHFNKRYSTNEIYSKQADHT